jgi:hypothetical protein
MATVSIGADLNDDDIKVAPYTLEVTFTGAASGYEVAIEYAGNPVAPQDATGDGTLWFDLSWAGSTTNETVRAKLRQKSNPANVADQAARYGLTFDTGGPPAAKAKNRLADPDALDGVPAAPERRADGAFPVGVHRSHFGPMDKPVLFVHARVLIQGRRPEGQHKLVYDLPASVLWVKKDGKWFAWWVLTVTTPLAAGAGLPTIVRPVLLDANGKVLRITTHPF